MTTSDWIALGVGVYAGLVATALLVLSIIRTRPRIIIELSGTSVRSGNHTTEERLFLRVINQGHQAINLASFGFMMADGGRYPYSPIAETRVLPAKDSHTFAMDTKHFKESVKPETRSEFKYVFLEDATGKCYTKKIPKRMRDFVSG